MELVHDIHFFNIVKVAVYTWNAGYTAFEPVYHWVQNDLTTRTVNGLSPVRSIDESMREALDCFMIAKQKLAHLSDQPVRDQLSINTWEAYKEHSQEIINNSIIRSQDAFRGQGHSATDTKSIMSIGNILNKG